MSLGRTSALRLYGVVANQSSAGVTLPHPAQLVAVREVAAVVAESPPVRRTPAPLNLDEYRSVVATIFAQCAIVPAPPGVIFRNRVALLGWLDLHHTTLCDGVAHVDGRVEARVHVRADPTIRTSEIVDLDGGRQGDIESAAMELFHLLGEDVAAWMLASRPGRDTPNTSSPAGRQSPVDGVDRWTPQLAPLGARHVVSATASSDLTRGDVRDASASFLVDRSRWRAFAEAVATAARRQGALQVELTGPWPPYDFVRLQFGG